MDNRKRAVALGLFDGVHLGHRAVINAALDMRKNGLSAVVFTFEPDCVLKKAGGASGFIYTQAEKEIILREMMEVDDIVSPPFESLCSLTGEEFAREILCRRIGAARVCCGNDFRFGKNAACGAHELTDFGKRFGFEVEVVSPVEYGGSVVSSSRIRELLLNGDIPSANELLGFGYFINAEVKDGNRIGRTIDFPTINQQFGEGQLVPKFGVYSTSTNVGGKVFPSVTNIGVKPTVGGVSAPLAETHIIGFSGDLYGKKTDVRFKSFIRSERKFSSLDELKTQISEDIEASKSVQ